ncbi:preprotein translocase [Candidatus Saccharibacteria bacterium RIFCSPHIGHO2_02_FULL_46_12]|nr:MAG: preprotein translocase [Candidatus Saccharibacteria bacterium RIFCSPHIGHO2_02_FULL_46_12]
MGLVDTHCHIHESDYPFKIDDVIVRAADAGVEKMICVGTDETSSIDAVAAAKKYQPLYSSIGVHPHEAKDGVDSIAHLAKVDRAAIVAIGEIGLDYFYTHSPREAQIAALEAQLQVAVDHQLPVIFHVREAFDDFWPVFENFHGLRGVLHSFTGTQKEIETGFAHGLYVGVNGISTFTKDKAQQQLFASMPLERVLLETDAPFLTPVPKRGTVNEPAFVRYIADHHATIRGISVNEVMSTTSANATALFAL